MRSLLIAGAIVLVVLATACTPAKPKSAAQPIPAAEMVTDQPLAEATAQDWDDAETILRADFKKRGLRDPKVKRLGPHGMPAGWFKKHKAKPYKVLYFIADAGQGGGRDYTMVLETPDSTWKIWGY